MTVARLADRDSGGRGAVPGDPSVPAGGFDPDRVVRDFGDVEGEVAACRTKAALFDFSFVSIARVSGPGILDAIAGLTDRRLDDLAPGRIRYALSRDPDGYLRSDLTVWNEGDGGYLVMSGRRRDIVDLVARAGTAAARGEDLDGGYVVFAVQGPHALRCLDGLVNLQGLAALPYFGFARFDVGGVSCLVGRLGYTGERGFEIILPAERRSGMWQRLAARARPSGFAAADCLRIEAGLVLFANEFRLPVTATEAGLDAFSDRPMARARCRLVCFRAETDEPPVLWRPPENPAPPAAGTITVTSACYSALAGGTLGLGFVAEGGAGLDRTFADPSGQFRAVRTVPRPFLAVATQRPRGPWPQPS